MIWYAKEIAWCEVLRHETQLQGAAFDLGVAASPPLLRANLLELLLQSAKRTPRSTAIAEMDDMFCGRILGQS